MTRIFYKHNPAKWTEFQQVAEGQILAAFTKLRRIGYSDSNIIDAAKIILGRVSELEAE